MALGCIKYKESISRKFLKIDQTNRGVRIEGCV